MAENTGPLTKVERETEVVDYIQEAVARISAVPLPSGLLLSNHPIYSVYHSQATKLLQYIAKHQLDAKLLNKAGIFHFLGAESRRNEHDDITIDWIMDIFHCHLFFGDLCAPWDVRDPRKIMCCPEFYEGYKIFDPKNEEHRQQWINWKATNNDKENYFSGPLARFQTRPAGWPWELGDSADGIPTHSGFFIDYDYCGFINYHLMFGKLILVRLDSQCFRFQKVGDRGPNGCVSGVGTLPDPNITHRPSPVQPVPHASAKCPDCLDKMLSRGRSTRSTKDKTENKVESEEE